jgi:hypothetical protein
MPKDISEQLSYIMEKQAVIEQKLATQMPKDISEQLRPLMEKQEAVEQKLDSLLRNITTQNKEL